MIDAAAEYSYTKPALGYIRVSREEQARNGVSLDQQRDRIKAYALAKGLQLLEIFADEGFSGKALNRPGVDLLLKQCATGEVGAVIVWKLDRLTRRTRDLLQMVEDVFLARGIEMHSVSESLDTSSPHGRFVLTLFGSLAQMEREQIAERTRGALAWKRENGLPTSHPPFGFRQVGKRTPMEPISSELEIVGRILLLWQQGRSYRSIAKELNIDGIPAKRGTRWHHTAVRKIVANRKRYEGLLSN